MQIYKKGQGKIVRRSAFISVLLFILYGCFEVYQLPHSESWWWRNIIYKEQSLDIVVRPILLVAVGVFLLLAFLAFVYLNKPKVADFLIEAEDEIRKVSWPSRKEYMAASIVVIVFVVVVALFLFFTDKGLSTTLEAIGIGF